MISIILREFSSIEKQLTTTVLTAVSYSSKGRRKRRREVSPP